MPLGYEREKSQRVAAELSIVARLEADKHKMYNIGLHDNYKSCEF